MTKLLPCPFCGCADIRILPQPGGWKSADCLSCMNTRATVTRTVSGRSLTASAPSFADANYMLDREVERILASGAGTDSRRSWCDGPKD